jgi:hypothetical protein
MAGHSGRANDALATGAALVGSSKISIRRLLFRTGSIADGARLRILFKCDFAQKWVFALHQFGNFACRQQIAAGTASQRR